MWYHLFIFTKFASYKVPPVMVSTHGSVVPLAMFYHHSERKKSVLMIYLSYVLILSLQETTVATLSISKLHAKLSSQERPPFQVIFKISILRNFLRSISGSILSIRQMINRLIEGSSLMLDSGQTILRVRIRSSKTP